MKELCSFKNVIESRFFDKIHKAVSEFLFVGAQRLDYRSKPIHEEKLYALTIKRVDVTDAPGDGIRFYVIAEAELEISEWRHNDYESDMESEWFRISCQGNLNGGLRDFEITDVSVYSPYKGNGNKLAGDLVPIISKEQFDDIAEAFLRDCGFAEAITTPMPIPVREVAHRMGLTIKETRLSRHFTIFGEMVFSDCEIECYYPDERNYKPIPVERGTILVDPDIYFMRNLGCFNNTIIHECFHWYKHRKHHELAGIYDTSAAHISCQVQETNRYHKDWRSDDWMEWQANGISSRILMPREATKRKVEELIRRYALLLNAKNRLAVMESVLFELADFFEVSRIAAKIRMIELGYKDVEGVATYVDDHYIGNYAFASEAKSRDQTFDICLSDAFFEYFSNREFNRLINSGNFTYIDSHYVIDNPKYIVKTPFGGLGLTDYAKLHIDECCIRFDLKYNSAAKPDIAEYIGNVEFRKAVQGYNRVPEFKPDAHNMEVFSRSEELKKFHEEYSDELTFLNTPVASFAGAAWSHIEHLGLSRKEFCDKTLLSEKTYDRIKANTIGKVTLQTVMLVAIGLNLGGVLGEQLIELAGYKLLAREVAYKKLLYTFKGHSVFECDEILTALGLESILPKQYRTAEKTL